MASPSKVRKDSEDTEEGFIHNVSPRKQQEYHRLVIFRMEKHATFSQVEKNGNAVRLRNVKRSISFSDQNGYDVACSRGTSVEVTRLQFMRFSVPSCRRMRAEVKALSPKQKGDNLGGSLPFGAAVVPCCCHLCLA
ncbi:hypothetical protein ABG768_021841 [Culter alburnus]|uniref:Uncharacterized protein n=1 Tax=Culter alburnus TaxID=194366 RepID=A0AAW2ASC7_CULAL